MFSTAGSCRPPENHETKMRPFKVRSMPGMPCQVRSRFAGSLCSGAGVAGWARMGAAKKWRQARAIALEKGEKRWRDAMSAFRMPKRRCGEMRILWILCYGNTLAILAPDLAPASASKDAWSLVLKV